MILILNYTKKGKAIKDSECEEFVKRNLLNVMHWDDDNCDDTIDVSTSNVINATCAMIARGEISNKFVSTAFNGKKIEIDEIGRCSEYPKGFCDQSFNWAIDVMKRKKA